MHGNCGGGMVRGRMVTSCGRITPPFASSYCPAVTAHHSRCLPYTTLYPTLSYPTLPYPNPPICLPTFTLQNATGDDTFWIEFGDFLTQFDVLYIALPHGVAGQSRWDYKQYTGSLPISPHLT